MSTKGFALFSLMMGTLLMACSDDPKPEQEILYSDDLKEFDLTRPARKITNKIVRYTDSAGVHIDSVICEDRFYFDSLGNQIKSELWNIPAQDFMIEAWTYDIKGRKQYYSWNPESHCGCTAKYFYDANDVLIRKEIYASDDTLMNIETYTYESGRMKSMVVEMTHMACRAEVANTRVFTYDDTGRLIRIRQYSESRSTDDCRFYAGDTTYSYPYGGEQRSSNYTVHARLDTHGAWTSSVTVSTYSNNMRSISETMRIIEYY